MMHLCSKTACAHIQAPHLSKVRSRHAGGCAHLLCFVFNALHIRGGLSSLFPLCLMPALGLMKGTVDYALEAFSPSLRLAERACR